MMGCQLMLEIAHTLTSLGAPGADDLAQRLAGPAYVYFTTVPDVQLRKEERKTLTDLVLLIDTVRKPKPGEPDVRLHSPAATYAEPTPERCVP
jgi:hypothetical protein